MTISASVEVLGLQENPREKKAAKIVFRFRGSRLEALS
ncbi:hypothetical protein THTE_2883 [Thermogutta terrifontis]|uniref:Uncharacterized protein n=1 Tax=Thermogutta terrifontis TaxID=1331910 RepID=A0A286RHP0_9BACT|nr:hypothetical protein THTE_2883 [Thermogutta terrifontis]GIX02757.1 MAG: hypothetical protein KatS3mg112_1694 [Thermogutta sp.]